MQKLYTKYTLLDFEVECNRLIVEFYRIGSARVRYFVTGPAPENGKKRKSGKLQAEEARKVHRFALRRLKLYAVGRRSVFII